jgi:hypothetical protein
MKQAVAPRRPLPELWQWAERTIAADVSVFTVAKVPRVGVPTGWTAAWDAGGLGPRRPVGNRRGRARHRAAPGRGGQPWAAAPTRCIRAGPGLLPELRGVWGGVADFPDAWALSDHAPVVAEFD